MKKLLCLFLVMLFCGSAMAEGFSLRNGISFGDTIEEVLSKETAEIDDIDDGSDEEESTSDADENEKEDEDSAAEYPYSITTKSTTLAGISDSKITYRFDANKTLREVVYDFRSSSYKDSVDSDYDTVNDGLIRKYGNPLGFSGGSCYIFTGSALESAVFITYLYDYLDGYGDIRDYDEWDVALDDYHVKIEQVEYYYGTSYSELKYAHEMSYTYFTDADLTAKQAEKRANQNAVDNDL